MIRIISLIGRAYDLVDSIYDNERGERECDALGLKHTDAPCQRCVITRQLSERERRAKARFLAAAFGEATEP